MRKSPKIRALQQDQCRMSREDGLPAAFQSSIPSRMVEKKQSCRRHAFQNPRAFRAAGFTSSYVFCEGLFFMFRAIGINVRNLCIDKKLGTFKAKCFKLCGRNVRHLTEKRRKRNLNFNDSQTIVSHF